MNNAKWTEHKIRNGFLEFLANNGRYPTALEIDHFDQLPSSRQIQRKFGGLVELRKTLGLPLDELDLTKGVKRSATAKNIGKRGKDFEKQIYLLLISKFGEIFVHAQKPFNDYSGRLDFFVYSKDCEFGLDVFYPTDMHSLIGCINLKSRTYKETTFDIIFISGNQDLDYKIIQDTLSLKKNKIPKNIRIMDLDHFNAFIEDLKPLQLQD